jgi:anti-sigma-K factor RskA
MNEFEWLRQMRELNQPVAPRNDLWARIDATLDDAEPSDMAAATPIKHARQRRTWTLAASLAAAMVLACGVAWRMHETMQEASPSSANITAIDNAAWKTSDPRLAGAALQLDAARMELQQAMQQAPDSPALQRLLQQTDAQQNRLRELEKQAG